MCPERIFLLGMATLILAETNVYAYADPGSGTLIWQIILAASIGVMFYIRRIISWVRGLKSDKKNDLAAKPVSAEAQNEPESVEK